MTTELDPAAVEVAIKRLRVAIAYDDDHVRISGRDGAAYVGDIRVLLASHAAIQAARDALRETVANYREDQRLK